MPNGKKPSYSGTDMRGPICSAMVTCDGTNLSILRKEKGICSKCEAAIKKKQNNTEPKPLRGAYTALREVQRRTILKKGEE